MPTIEELQRKYEDLNDFHRKAQRLEERQIIPFASLPLCAFALKLP